MATNRELKKALLDKLGITASALSRRVKKEQDIAPMPTEYATYLIAQENGIPISRYLSAEEMAEVRHLQVQKAGINSANSKEALKPRVARKTAEAAPRQIRLASGTSIVDPILPDKKLKEAAAMSNVYPVLYALENSIRELIKRVMSDKFGKDWWDTELTTRKLKDVHDTATGRMNSEKTKHSWHQRRGSHPIDYVQLDDLESILRAKKNHFHPDIIPDWEWLLHLFREIYPSRHVICHMNPLEADNSRDVVSWYRKWTKVLKSSRANIPD